jgi:glycosyltransferase involved in cell wall biosynthesis
MTDALGQSQVLPYLVGLANKSHQITILSAEKKKNFNILNNNIRQYLQDNNIAWHPVKYTSSPKLISTLYDIIKMYYYALKLHKSLNFDIVHCRSYVPALIGARMKQRFNIKFIFDMRGFWADERIDGRIWNIKNPLFKYIYSYFKKKEKKFISSADSIITLTKKAKNIIDSWHIKKNLKITVIPCCTDLNHFSKNNINPSIVEEYKQKLNISKDDFILVYLGSIGTWYMLDEMLDFFKQLLIKKSNAKFLFITNEPKNIINNTATKHNIPLDKIIIYPSSRHDLPNILSLCHLGIFFIKKSFSKQASSPTKHGELLAMGIPVIANTGIGDLDEIINTTNSGLIVNNFNINEYDRIINQIDNLLLINKENISITAYNIYDLDKGINLYDNVIKEISNLILHNIYN